MNENKKVTNYQASSFFLHFLLFFQQDDDKNICPLCLPLFPFLSLSIYEFQIHVSLSVQCAQGWKSHFSFLKLGWGVGDPAYPPPPSFFSTHVISFADLKLIFFLKMRYK